MTLRDGSAQATGSTTQQAPVTQPVWHESCYGVSQPGSASSAAR